MSGIRKYILIMRAAGKASSALSARLITVRGRFVVANTVVRLFRKLNFYTIKKGIRYLRHFGVKEFLIRLRDRIEPEEVPYEPWYEQHRASEQTLERQRAHKWKDPVRISIAVPLYRTPLPYLEQMLDSVRKQSYPYWELCLVNGSPEDEKLAAALERLFAPRLGGALSGEKASRSGEYAAGGAHMSAGENATSGVHGFSGENATSGVHRTSGKNEAGDVFASFTPDDRIRVCTLEKNLGIAGNTNAAIAMATGDYIGLLDHDDLLAPDALYEIAAAMEREKKMTGRMPEFLYTDEDKVEADLSRHFQPNLKPDFSPDLLRSNNYICHFVVFAKRLYERIGKTEPRDGAAPVYGLDAMYEGAQDYDFVLRCTEQAEGICHVPRILYHWRVSAQSTADNPISKEYAYEAGARAIEAHLARVGLEGEVSRKKDFGCYRVKYPVQREPLTKSLRDGVPYESVISPALGGRQEPSMESLRDGATLGDDTANIDTVSGWDYPLVSVIIPNKDEKETLEKCLTSIFEKTTWKNFEIIIVENNSETQEIFDYYKEIDGRNGVHVVYWDREFNYSAINNFGVGYAKGEYLLFLNNDMEVISPDWMEELLGHCQRPGTGIVGALLYYPDDTIQHAGIIVGIGGVAGSVFVGMKRGHTGYMHRESLQQDLSAVTAACMMVKREVFDAVGGFEEKLAIAFNDVDFCLKAREKGYLVVYDPYAELYHYESKTRGAEDTEEKARRFQSEIEYMRTHWIRILKEGDPYYNRNLSLSKWNYSLRTSEMETILSEKKRT